MDHSDNDYESNLPASHPARRNEFGSKHERTHRHRGGWGEAMELSHSKNSSSSSGGGWASSSSVVAVDLNQFRNTKVGSGYQARHVVRQKTAETSTSKTKIVYKNTDFPTGQGTNQKEKAIPAKDITTEELLKNDGLRAFRKEIESILSSS